ncbi:uncharacterized protein LOC134222409 [Armigeres subalbatus]|uniref:uncharacterized protein LOC134222409 n=1 Tax=Armigeres subalbatus TaxID=124917 RepID=UPI002ED064B1
MEGEKGARSPMDPNYLKCEENSEVMEDATQYRSLLGGLLYLAVAARLNIANAAAILGRKFCGPTQKDWTAAKRTLHYLKQTSDYYLIVGGDPDQHLSGYSDADWAGDSADRKSTSGMVFFFDGSAISWARRKRYAIVHGGQVYGPQRVWLRRLLSDLSQPQAQPTMIREDNQGCLSFVKCERK